MHPSARFVTLAIGTDPKLRRELLSMITASDPDAALELIDAALDR